MMPEPKFLKSEVQVRKQSSNKLIEIRVVESYEDQIITRHLGSFTYKNEDELDIIANRIMEAVNLNELEDWRDDADNPVV